MISPPFKSRQQKGDLYGRKTNTLSNKKSFEQLSGEYLYGCGRVDGQGALVTSGRNLFVL